MSSLSLKLALAIFLSPLGVGLSSVANADVTWIDNLKGGRLVANGCPAVCKNSDFKFAVPAGIHTKATKARGTPQVFYVCAANLRGWKVGFNIEFGERRCYVAYHDGGSSFGEHFYCLCSDKPIEPLKR